MIKDNIMMLAGTFLNDEFATFRDNNKLGSIESAKVQNTPKIEHVW